MRTGANALSLLAVPLNVHLLAALHEEGRQLADLSQAVGLPPASTMRTYLRALGEWGAVERKQETAFPGSVRYELTESGEALILTAEILQRWLGAAPNGGMALGSPAAKSAIKALVDGWNAAIVRALAARPCTLTELARAMPQISYPALERRLTAMRRAGQVEGRRSGNGRGTPYGATPWLREGVSPLVAAAAWERRHAPSRSAAVGRLDVEAAFLLAIPALNLPADLSGSCRLAVELRGKQGLSYAGATVTVRDGEATASARLEDEADARVTGNPLAWFRWINGGREEIEIAGDHRLAVALADALREAMVHGQPV